VKAVVRYTAGQDTVGHQGELTAGAAAKPLVHRVPERGRSDAVEQRVAHPVCLHDSVIERVGDSGCTRDEFQVGPGPIELPRQCGQSTVYDAISTISEQLLAI
jgi:hypothetical protein